MTDPNDQLTEEESFFPQDDLADSVQAMNDHFERVDAFLEEFNGFSGSDDQ
jgi:hypothetical protein